MIWRVTGEPAAPAVCTLFDPASNDYTCVGATWYQPCALPSKRTLSGTPRSVIVFRILQAGLTSTGVPPVVGGVLDVLNNGGVESGLQVWWNRAHSFHKPEGKQMANLDLLFMGLLPVVLIIAVSGVIILRPLTKRLGDLLELMYEDRQLGSGSSMDEVLRRLDGIEGRLSGMERQNRIGPGIETGGSESPPTA